MRLALILDLGALIFICLSVLFGRIKGMIKSLRGIVVPIIAVILAISLRDSVAPVVQRQPFFEKAQTKIEAIVIDRLPPLPTWGIEQNSLSEQQWKQLERVLTPFGIDAEEALQGMQQRPTKTSQDALMEMVSFSVARAIAFLIVFLLATLALYLLFALLSAVFTLPLLKPLNRNLGTVFGLVRGLVVVGVLSLLLYKLSATIYSMMPDFAQGLQESFVVNRVGGWLSTL